MFHHHENTGQRASGDSTFATTQWSIVLAAGRFSSEDAKQALKALCEAYWYPLYAYVRRQVVDVHLAEDLTQAFFAELLEKNTLGLATPELGRFRAYLLTACKRFIINEWHKARTAKRGSGRRPLSLDFDSGESRYSLVAVDPVTPEQLFDQQWAITLLERVVAQLREEYVAKGKADHFDMLKPSLAGGKARGGYAEAARVLGITKSAVKVAAHRMRKRYRELLRTEIAQTVERPEDIDDEIRDLFTVLGTAH